MRKTIIFTSLIAILGTAILFLHTGKNGKAGELATEGKNEVVFREPASAIRESSALPEPEVFEFVREVSAKIESKNGIKEFGHVQYQGTFSVVWKSIKTAQVFYTLEDGLTSKVTFEMDLHAHALDGIRTTVPLTEADEDSINILKDFASLYAFKSDQDTTGHYEAGLQERPNRISKQKIRYTDTSLKRLKITRSSHEVKLGVLSRVDSMKGEEKTEVEFGKGSTLKTVSTYLLKVNTGSSAMPVVRSKSEGDMKEASIILETRFMHLEIDWAKTMADVTSIASLDSAARLSLFHDLITGMKAQAQRINEFQVWMRAHMDESGVLTFGIGVLATVGSPEAQKVLLELYQGQPEARHLVLNAMATTDAPLTPEVRSFLAQEADQIQKNPDLAYNAALAMGSAMKKEVLPGEDQKMINWYQAASSLEEKTLYLDAMGNSGAVGFVPSIEKALASGEEMVREKAAFAARFMKGQDAQNLVSLAFDDPSPRVKSAAIKAISYQKDIAPFQNVLNRCIGEKSDLSPVCSQILNASKG